MVYPEQDSCCFNCYLPTRLCKGALLTDTECFSPTLLLVFWLLSSKIIDENREAEITDPSLAGDWVPEDWTPAGFKEKIWRLDTEMVAGAWFFYGFAKEFQRDVGMI